MGRHADPKPRRLTVTRYRTPEGKVCRKGTPGAIKKTEKTDSYYLVLPAPRSKGKRRHEVIPLETTDQGIAWKRVREILQRRHQTDLGLVDDYATHATRPLSEHVDDWLAEVSASKTEAKRVALLRARVLSLASYGGWEMITQIRRPSVQAALNQLQKRENASAQTRNHYLSHIRQFVRWLVRERRLRDDPLVGIRGVSVEDDRRHDRRILTQEEIRVLFDYLDDPKARVRCRMTGPQRGLGYQVSMCSGLRANELRSLTREHFDLPAGEVRVAATRTKNKKRASLPIPRWLADKLSTWFAGGGGTWEHFPADWPGRLLRADLRCARDGWIAAADTQEERTRRERSTVCCYEVQSVDGPLFLDFHALRHWYITQIASTDGITPAVLQALSRHSDPRLTLGTYAKAKEEGRRAAAEGLQLPGRESTNDKPGTPCIVD